VSKGSRFELGVQEESSSTKFHVMVLMTLYYDAYCHHHINTLVWILLHFLLLLHKTKRLSIN